MALSTSDRSRFERPLRAPARQASILSATMANGRLASFGGRADPPNETLAPIDDPMAEQPIFPLAGHLARAQAYSDLSTSQRNAGQRQDALAAMQQAVALFRTLAAEHPAMHNTDLAISLRTLSHRLSDVGKREEALAAIEEAVSLQRARANERPSDFNADLALSLNHYSNRLSRLERHEEALLAIQESVDLYRKLVEQQPESHKPGLAASLYNLSSRFSKYDLWEEALGVIQEACSIYQLLAAEHPSLYSTNLAASQKKLSACTQGHAQQVGVPSAGRATVNSTSPQGLPSTSRASSGVVHVPGRPQPIGPRRGQFAARGSIFYSFGNKEVINVGGNYVAAEEPVAKISRILPYADGASWDPSLTCLPGTRLALLKILGKWARGAASERICWLKGPAGCGKTTVLHTIAQELKEEGLLASTFFFSRDTESRNTAKTLFTTLARDIASLHPDAAQDIANALEAEPDLATAPLSRQFDALILGPSRHLPANQLAVFVIDALDESFTHDLDIELLTILRDKVNQLPPHVRILVTSRPTSVIEEHLHRCSHVVAHSIDVHSVENKGDIDMYVDTQLRDEAILRKMGLISPDEAIIRDLKRLAEGLFVWIVTICNFLRTAHRPKQKLQALLSKSSQQGTHPEKKMDQLYAAILVECGDWEDADFVKDYDLVIGTIMALKRPLSLDALRALHDGSLDLEAEQLLQRFGSVLTGIRGDHQPIRTLHLSFHEFVTNRAANDDSTKRFHLSEKEHSGRLAELCVKTLNRELAQPIDGTGYLAIDTLDAGIPKILDVSEQLVYGCAHWPSHLQDVETPQTIQAHIIPLISRHLVTWIEVLAATDVFRGSLQIGQWIQRRAPELEHRFQRESQAEALFVLGNRLGYAARMEESQVATQEAVILFRALAAEQPVAHNATLARCLTNLSLRLSNLGQAQDALSTSEEAVRLHRPLAAERPAVFNDALASSLINLSLHLSALGRAQEALSAVEEAVNLHRALVAERPAAGNADLAASLNNLSTRLSALGRAQEALSAGEEALNLYRALAAERPAAYTAGLAWSLNILSAYLAALGRAQEALSAVEESVNLYRVLAAERPAACNADLAASLSNFSIRLSDLGRAREALSAGEEAVNLYRPLAAERPAACNANLAKILNNLSLHLSALGRAQEALSAAEEAVNMYRALAAERPAAYNADLATSLNNFSIRLSDLGRAQEALSAVEEAVNLNRALAAERPAPYNADLAQSLNNFSERLSDLGRAQEALSAVEEAVRLHRPLAAERPAVFNDALASSLTNLSLHLSALGRAQEALSAAEEALNLYRALAAERPAADNADLAASLNNFSNHLSALGRAQEALSAVEEAVNLRRALAAERPAAYNGDLADSLNNISGELSALGRPQEGLSAVQEAVHLYRALVTERPAAYNADLAMSLRNLSTHLSGLGRAQEALSAIREAVDLRRALAAELPAIYNAKLADSILDLSLRLLDLGQHGEALNVIPEAVDLHRALAAERPAQFNKPLMVSLKVLNNAMVYLGLDVPTEIGQEITYLQAQVA
ncbi:hypothetical protein HWV62_19521 [Athelia sp. TMB]|nr:hypothetical protein HWV62_19521 [Athelia sp. TMB]